MTSITDRERLAAAYEAQTHLRDENRDLRDILRDTAAECERLAAEVVRLRSEIEGWEFSHRVLSAPVTNAVNVSPGTRRKSPQKWTPVVCQVPAALRHAIRFLGVLAVGTLAWATLYLTLDALGQRGYPVGVGYDRQFEEVR